MLDLNARYEILSFSVGDTKAGTKMGKMQIKNLETLSILNCVLWEEALNRIPEISTRVGNIIRIITGSYNEKFNNCLLNNFEVLEQAILGLDEEERIKYFNKIIDEVNNFKDEKISIQSAHGWQGRPARTILKQEHLTSGSGFCPTQSS